MFAKPLALTAPPQNEQSGDFGRANDDAVVAAQAERPLRQLAIEADKARRFGKIHAMFLMQALARCLPSAPQLYAKVARWPGDLASDAVVFRLNAGLHALALGGKAGGLAPLFAARPGETLPERAAFDRALRTALTEHQGALIASLAHPTQTNEVARIAGLIAVLRALDAQKPMACEVLEIGSSAGLNLNLAHYDCGTPDFLGESAFDDARLALNLQWHGASVEPRKLAIERAIGVDLQPLSIARPCDRERLAACIWPGEHARSKRLARAIDLAALHPPQVDQASAGDWIARQLSEAQRKGTRRIIFHSMVWQYIAAPERAAIEAAMAAAGARASADRPLVRVGLEWCEKRLQVELRVTRWSGASTDGKTVTAALCHPYGEWFDWRGLKDERASDKS